MLFALITTNIGVLFLAWAIYRLINRIEKLEKEVRCIYAPRLSGKGEDFSVYEI